MTTPIFESSSACYVLRPDRFYQRLVAGNRGAEIDPALVQDLLQAYRLPVTGRIVPVGGQGRSATLIVTTIAGRKLLKRYKPTVEREAIRCEHSILRRLEQLDFPAPRLVATAGGETVLERNGQYFALFEVLDGYFQYHNYLLLPFQARAFIAASGRVLGMLHQALRDCTPEGHHPQGMQSRTGQRWRELDWYLERLRACRAALPHMQADDAYAVAWAVGAHGSWVEETVQRLNEQIMARRPLCLVIHGDYGPYNLLFKPGAPIVVLDFELARLDWRLTDLANALPSFASTRLGFNVRKMRCFLEAYRSACWIDDEELHLLPSVWLFLTLRRVIVFWHRYCTTQARQWWIAAQHKLTQAQWLEQHHTSLLRWLGSL